MTREEAKCLVRPALWEHFGHKLPDGVEDIWLDCWVALGMLKLDQPKSVRDRAIDALVSIRIGRTLAAPAIIDTLSDAGLKIVEK